MPPRRRTGRSMGKGRGRVPSILSARSKKTGQFLPNLASKKKKR